MVNPAYTKELSNRRAIGANNVKHFIIPWLSFRLHIVFKPPQKASKHFYGNEHACTLNQLRAGYHDHVVLDKYKGLTDLITLVEKTWKGKWLSAKIYMRTTPGSPFDTVVRSYFNGEIQEENSPVLEPETAVQRLFFHGITDTDVRFSLEPLPDFKKELQNFLQNDTSSQNQNETASV